MYRYKREERKTRVKIIIEVKYMYRETEMPRLVLYYKYISGLQKKNNCLIPLIFRLLVIRLDNCIVVYVHISWHYKGKFVAGLLFNIQINRRDGD